MSVLKGAALGVFIAITSASPALADDWISPDGLLVVTAPEASDFEMIEDPPEPFLVLWLSTDESLRLGVTKSAIPANIRLIRSSTERGMAEEIGGSITASSTIERNGHEVWIMSATAGLQGMTMQVTQAVVQHEADVYKVMAAAVGDSPVDQAAIDRFVNSLQITIPARTDGVIPDGRDQEPSDQSDIDKLSQTIGGVSLIVLIALLIWHFVRRRQSRVGKPQ